MKQFLITLFIVLALAAPAWATDVTIAGYTSVPGFQVTGLPAEVTYSVSVTGSSPTVTPNAPLRYDLWGKGGYTVEINGSRYVIASINYNGTVITLASNYGGSTSASASLRFFRYVEARIFSSLSFYPAGSNNQVMGGQNQPPFIRYACSIINEGGREILYVPQMVLPATTPLGNTPTNLARYNWGFYRPETSSGNSGQPLYSYNCSNIGQFRLPETSPTSWRDICAYNVPSQIQLPTTYVTTNELYALFPSCTANSLAGFIATGRAQSCVTVGSRLTLSGGVLSADVQVTPPTLQNQGVSLTQRSTQNLQLPFLKGVDIPELSATNLNLARTPTGVYNAVTDLNISADPRLYLVSQVIPSGANSVILTGVTAETQNYGPTADTATQSYYPLRYYANSLNTWRVGQGIRIPDGVSSGVDLIATITAVSGNTLTFTPATTNANAIDFVQHDDTAAVRSFFSTYTAGTLQIPDGWIPVSSFYNYDANHPYAISFPAVSEARNEQWVIEGSEKYRSAFIMTGPGHLLKPSSTSPNTNLTIKNLGIFHVNRYTNQDPDNASAGAGLYLASDQFTLGDGVPQSGATAIHLENLHFIGWKYAIFSDNLQSSHFRNLSIYYCNNGIVLPATSNVRGLGSQTEPNANQIEQTFIQYAPVLSSNTRRTVTVTTAGAHNTSGTDIGDASAIVTITSGSVSSDDLYRLVAIAGASVNQTQHTALITRIIDSTHVELSQPPWIATTGLTMTLYPRAFAHFYTNNGNNIQIRGGTWQGNWTNVSSGDELYAMLVENSDEITMEGIWIEGNGGSGGSAVQANSVRNLRIINSNFGAGGTPSGYGVGLRLNNVIGATIDGAYIATSGDAAADIFLENGTRGVSVDNTTLTSPQSILYGNLLDSTPDFYPPKLGLGMRYLEGTNSGPIYDAGDLYNTLYARNQLVDGNLARGGTGWTLTAPAALTFVNTGTARGLRYVRVAPTTSGGGAYSEQLAQTTDVPDSIPENQTVTLGFDFYIESRGAQTGSIYDGLRVKLIPSVGTTGQFGYSPSTAQGKLIGRWERGSITTRIGAGTGRTLKVQLECGTGADAAVFRLSNFRLTYGTKATFDDDEVISELRGGTIQTPSTLTFNGVSNGCAQFTSGYLTSTGVACGSGGGGGGGITSITAPSGGAQTGPGIAFALGTSGTDASIAGSTNTITFNFPTASASNRGLLSASDFSMFNGKVGGAIANTQIAVGSGTSISGSNNLVAGGGSVLSLGSAASAIGFSQTNSSSLAGAQAVFALSNNTSDQFTVGLTGGSHGTSGLFKNRQAFFDAGTGIAEMLFRVNDSGTGYFKWGISTTQVARLDETGLAIGTITPPTTKIDVASTGLAAGFAGIRFRNINNGTSPDTGITSGYLGVDASGYVKVITTPGGMPDPGANGVVVRTALNTTTARTLTGTANEITIADGNGVSNPPTFSLSSTFDISGKTSTKPMKSGTTAGIPGTCAVGEYYFATDASAGSNTYACTSLNTWTVQAVAGSAGALSALTAATGSNSINNGDNAQTWNWALTTSGKTGFAFTENTAGTSLGTPHLVSISTKAGSTINPLQVVINSDTTPAGIRVNTSGQVVAVGSGGVNGAAIVGANTVPNSVLDADLATFAANSTTGFWAYTGAGTGAARTLTAGSSSITVTNGNGVSGNPTINTVQPITTVSTPQFSALGLGGATPPAFGLAVNGLQLNTEATGTTGAGAFLYEIQANDTDVKSWYGLGVFATNDAGGSNANKTNNLIFGNVDTGTGASTGITTNLLHLQYGGASKFTVNSAGDVTVGSTYTYATATARETITATVNGSIYSAVTNESTGSSAIARFGVSSDVAGGGLYSTSSTFTPSAGVVASAVVLDMDGVGIIKGKSGSDLRFLLGSTEYMRLDSNALGLPVVSGATPTANGKIVYDSGSNTLEFGENGTTRVVASLGASQTFTGANTFSTSTNVFSSRAEFSSFYLDAPGSFNLRIVPGSVLTADRTLTITTPTGSNATWNVQGSLGLGGDLNSSAAVTLGTHALTFTTTGSTNVTLPTTGTLATLAGTETFSNKSTVGLLFVEQAAPGTPAADRTHLYAKNGESNISGLFVKSDNGRETPVAMPGQYALKFDSTQNHLVNHGFFWPASVNLSKVFFWDAWIKPTANGGYIISEGYGGNHSLLFGTAGIGVGTYNNLTGNVFDGSSDLSFGSDDGPIAGEWAHVAVGSDGNKIVTYINGVPAGAVTYTLTTRQSQQGTLFIGGSGHNNFDGLIAQVRGFEGVNPLYGSFDNANRMLVAYRPETRLHGQAVQRGYTTDEIYASFLADYTAGGVVMPDYSPVGYNGGHHPGQLWSTSGVGDGTLPGQFGKNTVPSRYPLPAFVADLAAPTAQTTTAPVVPTSATLTPPSTPVGALVFDSFSRADQTFAFDTVTPTLGNTEAGSLGALAWSYNAPGVSDGIGDAGYKWGILKGRAVALGGPNFQAAFVNVSQSNMEVSVDRRTTASYQDGRTGLLFRGTDGNNFWYLITDGANPAAQTVYWGRYVAGSRTNVGSAAAPANSTWATLKVTVSAANQITIYADATQLAQFTDATFSTATRAGIYMDDFGNGFSGLARFDNFTVKSF